MGEMSKVSSPSALLSSSSSPFLMFRVIIQDASSICCSSGVPYPSHAKEHVTLRGGRPIQFPDEIDLWLWGGLSGYTQEMERKRLYALQLCSACAYAMMFFVALVLAITVSLSDRVDDATISFEFQSSSYNFSIDDIFVYSMFLASLFISLVSNRIQKHYDDAMKNQVTDILQPVFRSKAGYDLTFDGHRGICYSSSYFTIRKLSDEERTQYQVQGVGNSSATHDTCYHPIAGSIDEGCSTSSIKRDIIDVPVVSKSPCICTNHALPLDLISNRPPEINRFAWGALMECLQQVEKPYREQQLQQMRVLQMLTFFVALFGSLTYIDMYYALRPLLILIFVFATVTISHLTSIYLLSSYPPAYKMHEKYEHALLTSNNSNGMSNDGSTFSFSKWLDEHIGYTVEFVVNDDYYQSSILQFRSMKTSNGGTIV